jgi:hypothetical protein
LLAVALSIAFIGAEAEAAHAVGTVWIIIFWDTGAFAVIAARALLYIVVAQTGQASLTVVVGGVDVIPGTRTSNFAMPDGYTHAYGRGTHVLRLVSPRA